jgi:hypothetical protein
MVYQGVSLCVYIRIVIRQMRFECECDAILSEQTSENGEIKATVECHECGNKYAATISEITSF